MSKAQLTFFLCGTREVYAYNMCPSGSLSAGRPKIVSLFFAASGPALCFIPAPPLLLPLALAPLPTHPPIRTPSRPMPYFAFDEKNASCAGLCDWVNVSGKLNESVFVFIGFVLVWVCDAVRLYSIRFDSTRLCWTGVPIILNWGPTISDWGPIVLDRVPIILNCGPRLY